MMTVKTYVQRSVINGIGLFAAEPIKAGTITWKWDASIDIKIKESQLNQESKIIQEFITKYAWYNDDTYYLCADNARFINHSETSPNIKSDGVTDIAIENIDIGEELICNYWQFHKGKKL